MADTIVSAVGIVTGPIIENLIFLLKSRFRSIREVGKDAEKLLRTLSTIKIVLEDAEAKQLKNRQILEWLEMLKNAAYDAEDVLDAWSTKIQQREMDFANGGCSSQVSHSISTCLNLSEVLFRYKMAKKMKEMISTFDDIAEQKNKFHLNANVEPQNAYVSGRETSSSISEPKIYGRDNDQESIIKILLGHESSQECVLPILGFGGVGKTTLAKLVHNSETVTKSFEVRIWVCVSEPFDVKKILKAIVEFWDKKPCDLVTLESIQSRVKEILINKKYFVVLDDVWNQNEDKWNELSSSLSGGAKGSSVLVTTRSPTVASIIGTVSPYRLGVLSDDDCWSLLKYRALRDRGEEEHQNLVSIGKEIAKRCKGVPLAAKSLGGLLRSKIEENHWKHVRDNEIWNLEVGGDDDILPVLRLTYNHLPSNLKQRFAYCSIFPKDYNMKKFELICLWIANGFIQAHGMKELEEIGDDIFNELLQWSFFQDAQEDGYGNIVTCKMHDLMHDLASFIARNDCRNVDIDKRPDIPESIRHLTVFLHSSTLDPPLLRSLPSLPLRTLLFLDSPNIHGLVFQRTLRVLDISGTRTLPPSVLHLKQLRYLNLSNNDLKSLPKSICRLVNLQVLNLSQNMELETLPSSIDKLEHLRYLNLSHTEISSLPDSICRLRNLWWLDLSENDKITILPQSIGNLTNLRYLDLRWCGSLESLPDSICRLRNLWWLDLSNNDKITILPQSIGNLTNLRHLDLSWCWSLESLPDSICRLRNLWWLDLSYNQEITILPQSIGNLTNLRHLNLSECNSLESLPETVCDLMNLQSLLLSDRNKLKELPKNMKNMRSLIHLYIVGCELRKLPSGIGELTSLRTLGYFPVAVAVAVGDDDSDSDIRDGCGSGAAGIDELHGLNQLRGSLQIVGLENVRNAEEARMANLRSKQYLTQFFLKWSYYEEDGSLQAISNNKKSQEVLQGLLPLPPNLRWLRIHGYGAEEFPPQIFQEGGGGVLNPTLQYLAISCCPKLKSLPAEIGDLKALKSLGISNCKELVSFPKELQKLTSLTVLSITACPELELESGTPVFDHLVSLETLMLGHFPKLTALPDAIRHLPMLQKLEIWDCENLRTLPDWLKHLTILQSLKIYRCHPDLKERCERDEGEDWDKISHIPNIEIDFHKISSFLPLPATASSNIYTKNLTSVVIQWNLQPLR